MAVHEKRQELLRLGSRHIFTLKHSLHERPADQGPVLHLLPDKCDTRSGCHSATGLQCNEDKGAVCISDKSGVFKDKFACSSCVS